MTNIKFSIDATKFNKFLSDAPDKVHRAIRNVIYKVTLLVERGAKINAPVDTGRLRASISTSIFPMNASVQTNVKYAIYVHEGTRYVSARPFMKDAANDVEKQVAGIVNDELKALE